MTSHCVASIFDFAQQLWTFVNSKEGHLLLWIILASHSFSRTIRSFECPEADEFAAAVLAAMLLALLIVASETGVASFLKTKLRDCTESYPVALAKPGDPVH